MNDQPKQLLTTSEVASFLRVSPDTIRRLVVSKKLIAYRLGGSSRSILRFEQTEIERFLLQSRGVKGEGEAVEREQNSQGQRAGDPSQGERAGSEKKLIRKRRSRKLLASAGLAGLRKPQGKA